MRTHGNARLNVTIAHGRVLQGVGTIAGRVSMW